MDRFDYIIIGAGSAGCVLANRLSADPKNRVLLLEAGVKDNSILVQMPAGVGSQIGDKGTYNWGFWTESEPHLDDRKLWWPRGKGWGGSSSINGMIYIRGHARDYDQWRQMGLEGWAYKDVLPYFKRSESLEGGGDPWHGGEGPLKVSKAHTPNPIYKATIEAGGQAGYKITSDFNGFQQEGWGPYQFTIHKGERWSAAKGYLHPILNRPNLTNLIGVRTTRILIENGVAIGVEYADEATKARTSVYADKEVLVCAGAVQSPQILQLSGIGDPEELGKHGIPVVHALKGVGANLQDHLDVTLSWECPKPITIYSQRKGLLKTALVGLNWLLFRKGVGATQALESGAFLKSRPDLDRPDLQVHCVLAVMQNHGKTQVEKDGFTFHVCQLRPESRGRVGLKSADPFDDPAIFANYLSAEEDRRALREGAKMMRQVASQAALDEFRSEELFPGTSVQTDEELDAWIRANSETIYHPVGTCRMGTLGDPMAVVDAELRVQGLKNLRVIDASVMPNLVGGNTNAPTIMIAEKASDLILGLAALPADDAPVYDESAAA
ncbi:MAG: choline dehydrogenase [Alphaproteobacteria bacterium]